MQVIILPSAFSCCTTVEVADENISHVSCFTDFIGRLSGATKARPQKSADFYLFPFR